MKSTIIILVILWALPIAVNSIIGVIKKRKAGDDTADAYDLKSVQKIINSVLSKVGLYLFTSAEKEYGDGTGQLKMSAVISELIKLLPENVTSAISMDRLQECAEEWLTFARDKWKTNPALLDNSEKVK